LGTGTDVLVGFAIYLDAQVQETRHDLTNGLASLRVWPPRFVVVATRRAALARYLAHVGTDSEPQFQVRVPPFKHGAIADASPFSNAYATVIDLELPGGQVLALLKRLTTRYPALPIVALACCAAQLDVDMLRQLLGNGVHGVIDLHSTPEETRSVLEEVQHGSCVVRTSTHRLAGCGISAQPPGGPLTDTDLRLLSYVATGMSDREIAQCVHRSPHTVKHHIERLKHKIGVRNRMELAAWAGQNGYYATLPEGAP
jgi:DNA-binding NarL/FixJ family response regulator